MVAVFDAMIHKRLESIAVFDYDAFIFGVVKNKMVGLAKSPPAIFLTYKKLYQMQTKYHSIAE